MKYSLSAFTMIFLLASCSCKNVKTDRISFLPSELNAQRQQLDNKEVLVRGYLIYEPGNYTVWDSRQAMNSGDIAKCISMVTSSTLRVKLANVNRKNTYLTGVFKSNVIEENKIYLGLCNATGILVSGVELN